jgi:hypothetical protein
LKLNGLHGVISHKMIPPAGFRWTFLPPGSWRRDVPPKRRLKPNGLRGVIFHKMISPAGFCWTYFSVREASTATTVRALICLECSNSRVIHDSALEVNRESARTMGTAGGFFWGCGGGGVPEHLFTDLRLRRLRILLRPWVMGLYTDTDSAALKTVTHVNV